MERLTFDGKFCDIAQCREPPGGSFCENIDAGYVYPLHKLKEVQNGKSKLD